MSRKILYIILIIAVLIIISLLIWYFYFASKQERPQTPVISANFTVPGQNTEEGRLQTISEWLITSLNQNNNGEISFYDFSGQLWKLNSSESKPVLSDQSPIKNIVEVIWSKNAANIVKSGINQRDISYTLSDPDQKLLSTLKADIKATAFSPDGKKIVYYVASTKGSGLLTSDSAGKNQKTLTQNLKLTDINLNWPNSNIISIISKPSGKVPGNLWFLDIRNLNINKMIDSLFGLEVLFSPDGKSFIYSYTDQNGKNPALAVHDSKNNQKTLNNLSVLTDKCVWAKDSINIYCAVPKSWPDFAVLPDDYYKNIFSTNDDIWKINTETGEKALLFEYVGDISNLTVSGDENSIFFISRGNPFLYKLNLK